MNLNYVYILRSESYPQRHYVGLTDRLEERLKEHNSGQVRYTKPFIPWTIKTAIGFENRERAAEFEAYLKTAAGRAFSKKRL
jgi:putative endonuclease